MTLLYGALVGLSLGLTGGGGSILAVPLLVFGLGMDFRSAVAVSLAVVGLTASFGAVLQAGKGHVLWGAGAILGIGGILAAPFGAWVGARLSTQLSLMLFSAIMVFIAVKVLIRNEAPAEVSTSWISCGRGPEGRPQFKPSCAIKLLIAGALTGVLSGIFGVGGGFLVVPALLVVTCVNMELALATSLVGIALISASAFVANLGSFQSADFKTALMFLLGSAVGMTLGIRLKPRLPGRALQVLFASGVLVSAAFVIFKSL
jgi:uncharacterized membrane protein YfcA